ncbi:MAG: TonB-dependent receptor, partial [Comamonadaceae bacterium]
MHKVTAAVSSTAHRRYSADSRSAARERCGLRHIDDVPVAHQTSRRRVEASITSSGFRRVVGQRSVQNSVSARSYAVHVLDGGVQRISSRRTHQGWRNVSHVENFNITFTGVVSLVSSRQNGVQAVGNERLSNALGKLWQRARNVRSYDLSRAIWASRNCSSPHVAWRHEHLEVKNVVRVQSATEANLHSLAVRRISVHNVHHGHVAVLRIEIRNQQSVANTAFSENQVHSGRGRQDTRTDQKSLYASSRWQLAEPLHLLLGGRITSLDYKAVNVITGAPISDYRQSNEFTPYAGLVFDVSKQWSVYGSYSDIFLPQSGYLTASGAPLDPAIGANYEAGVKGELYGGRLNLSAAVFRIERTGIATLDPNNPGACPGSLLSIDCYTNGGKSRSKGFELEASGELTPGWQIAAGYTHVMSRGSDGQSLSSETPHHLLRAST